ncbi:Ctr copper transporter family [Seminavis robusta]|uniref:Copper transport protein n=1 Tax=Seminavis robusta TaxID=568900 RepID=A0A9N8DA01_9STRA|nr:Ctr copper transporter family [Seminavis robusta]|eukprot:Sro29_g019340.1 Ctr copper transporter family (267) ;mRNA; r:159004-159891
MNHDNSHHHHSDHQKEEGIPFMDKLLENPLEFSVPAVADTPPTESDHKDTKMASGHDDGHHVFCGSMMHMNDHEMAQHGVGSMKLGGDMSKGMVMYMDGFRFAMAGNQPCLNLYFPSWTLDTRWKFSGSLLLVFLLAFGTEAVSKFRHVLSKRPIAGRGDYQARRTRQMMISALHGFQALLGYVVMLATMTFSIEILLAVVLGLSTGYYYYFAGEMGLEGHVTTNPCCSYMQDESDEHEQAQQQQQQQQAAAEVAALLPEVRSAAV